MKLDEIYYLLREDTTNNLVGALSSLHRKVRFACMKMYRLHLNADMFAPTVYKEKLRASVDKVQKLKEEYHNFLETHKDEILLNMEALKKIKEFKERNPSVFSNK